MIKLYNRNHLKSPNTGTSSKIEETPKNTAVIFEFFYVTQYSHFLYNKHNLAICVQQGKTYTNKTWAVGEEKWRLLSTTKSLVIVLNCRKTLGIENQIKWLQGLRHPNESMQINKLFCVPATQMSVLQNLLLVRYTKLGLFGMFQMESKHVDGLQFIPRPTLGPFRDLYPCKNRNARPNNYQLITYYKRVSYLEEYIQYIVEYTYNKRNKSSVVCQCVMYKNKLLN